MDNDPTPLTTRVSRGLSIAIGLLSVLAFALQSPGAFKWIIGLLFAAMFCLHIFELKRGQTVETLYPDSQSRMPMLTLELLSTLGGIAVLMS